MLRTLLLASALIGLLSACQAAPRAPVYPDLTFANLAPFRFDAASLEIVEAYKPPLKPPNVEHEFPLTPAAAARRWAADRVKAVGTQGLVRFIVREASVVEVPLKRTEGLKGLITEDQAERYDARLVIEIEVRDERGFKRGFVSAVAKRSRTVPENMTLNERDQIFFEITEALMQDINAELEKQVITHLARFLR